MLLQHIKHECRLIEAQLVSVKLKHLNMTYGIISILFSLAPDERGDHITGMQSHQQEWEAAEGRESSNGGTTGATRPT